MYVQICLAINNDYKRVCISQPRQGGLMMLKIKIIIMLITMIQMTKMIS